MDRDSVPIVCPRCHAALGRGKRLRESCGGCGFAFFRVRDVPVLRAVAADEKLDYCDDAHGLPTQNSSTLEIPFVREAMSSGGLVLELGAGHDVCALPQLVKTDAYVYSPELDYVADGHGLPFADGTFDYAYSLAAFEHLHSPWIVASEIFRVLKPGGKVYTLAAFYQHVHGYPSHYFNMTEMGLRRVFSGFEILECEPSRFSPFAEIAYGLADLAELVRARKDQCAEQSEDATLVTALDAALIATMQAIPPVQASLMHVPKGRAAWRRIAPGIDLIARKPLTPTTAISLPTLDPDPSRRHAALAREIAAMEAEVRDRSAGTPSLPPPDSWHVARRNGVAHYLREFASTLRAGGWKAATMRTATWARKMMRRST